MNTNVSLPTNNMRGWLMTAVVLTGLSLLVAPFRASAGLRALALLLSLVILLVVWWRSCERTIFFPESAALRLIVVAWLLVVLGFALASPDWRTSMAGWRGDVVTPILAAIVCYSITRSLRAVCVLLVALLVGLLVLTGMVIDQPFAGVMNQPEPRYVNVGWLTTWLVMLASLLPLAWLMPWARPRMAKALVLVGVVSICVATWFTYNRMVWICLLAMFLVFAVLNFRQLGRSAAVRWGILLIGCAVGVSLIVTAIHVRASIYDVEGVSAIGMLKSDERQVIWSKALPMIAEQPLTGYGFSLERVGDLFSQRFDDPRQRQVFRHPHNMILHYAMQIGVFGALIMIALFALLALAFWRKRNVSEMTRLGTTCGLMLLAGFVLRNMVDDFFARHALLLFAALTGMLLAIADGRMVRSSTNDQATSN
jgi:O-antigen ligase